ncbi:hypothetical protein ACPV5G_20655 [Photobacterium damselae]|uniref:hypothetical protein n=1 Tax=Photobacterium damselae TaxID=38293 RepID=UPI00406961FA
MVRVIIEFEESIIEKESILDVNIREVAKEENPTVLERACILAIRSFIASNIPCPTTFIDAVHQIERGSDHH